MRLENNQLIQGLVELKWMTREAVPLLSTRMYEDETSVVGKLRAHGLTAEAVFEAAIFANAKLKVQMPVVDLAMIPPMAEFDSSTFATTQEMHADFIVPIMMLEGKLIVATADPFNEKCFDTLALRSPLKIDYWLADSEEITKKIDQLNKTPATARFKAKAVDVEPVQAVTPVTPKMDQNQGDQSERKKDTVVDGADYTSGRKEPTLSYINHLEQSPQADISAQKTEVVTPESMSAVEPRIVTPTIADSAPLPEKSEDTAVVDSDSSVSDTEEITSVDDLRFVDLQDSSLDTAEFETRVEIDEDSQAFYDAADETIIVDTYDEPIHKTVTQDSEVRDSEGHESDVHDSHIENSALETSSGIISGSISDNESLMPANSGSNSDSKNSPQVNEADEEALIQSSAMIIKEVLDEVAVTEEEIDTAEIESVALAESVNGADIVEYINFVLLDAITQKASDIHFEPYESSYRIRFRIDGILHKVYVLPEQYRNTIASRLKVMAELDIAEKRLPQDGHITICIEDAEIDARISVIPTLWGEKVVIRLLDKAEMNLSLAKLGLTPVQKGIIQAAIEKSQGLILVTGPTGSGKTVSLYACLNHLNDPSRNIATVEDPIEINLEGINQLQIHPKIGLDFAEALRSFLRQDPDVLMVGEIRDFETADITMKAAQTGHLVLSTLHTNNAVESLVRLKNMGIELYNIASTVKLVVAQRLLRELCHCKEEDIVDSDYLETLGFTPMQAASRFYRASGCSECHDGYRGRFAIFEVMPISKRMESLILEGASSGDIRAQAEREGIKSLRQSGIDVVIEGKTSLEEVLRVTVD